jgi:hypothetical protein
VNPKTDPAISLLLAFRQEEDALQLMAEYLKLDQMSPQDRVRTRMEIRLFALTGDTKKASDLLVHAEARRNQGTAVKLLRRQKE